MRVLTEKQKDLIKFIAAFQLQKGMSPTMYEIADHYNITLPSVRHRLQVLQRKGILTWTIKARSLQIIAESYRNDYRPSIPAIPLEDKSGQIGEWRDGIQGLMSNARDCFAFKISDDAMHDFGICTNDIVLVKRSATFNPGNLVVAKVANTLQLRCCYPTKTGHIELRPANPDFQSQTYPESQVAIRGIVIALQREY